MSNSRTEQQIKRERQSERAERFWSAFRFTENGKPKSSLIVYTFSLSLVYAAVYFLFYEEAIRLLTGLTASLSAWAGNAFIALTASAAGAAVCCLPHRFFRDKRLVLGGHLWLCLYALAVLVTMLILLGFTEAFASFLTFFAWFLLPPTALGTVLAVLLFSHNKENAIPVKEPEPEWKKYTERR